MERFWSWIEGDGSGAVSGLGMLAYQSRTFWEARDEANVHLFHYGDLRADLAAEMTRLADALGVEPPTDDLVDAARFERMKARADELVPNSDGQFWHSSSQFFEKARSGDWRDLVGEDAMPRYEAALQAYVDDEELVDWLHTGWRG